MNFIAPLMFDILNFQTWKVKMSMYLKALGIHVYLATIKYSYFVNGKNLEANAKAIHTLKSTLNGDYLSWFLTLIRFLEYETLLSFLVNKRNITRGVTRIKEVLLPTCAIWFKRMTLLR